MHHRCQILSISEYNSKLLTQSRREFLFTQYSFRETVNCSQWCTNLVTDIRQKHQFGIVGLFVKIAFEAHALFVLFVGDIPNDARDVSAASLDTTSERDVTDGFIRQCQPV